MNIKMHASFTYQKRIKQMFFNLPFVNLNTAKGEHPRMGALDVCPFIPVQDVSVEECVEISKKFGQKMATELGVPVFLYGYASEKDYRKTMPQVSKKS